MNSQWLAQHFEKTQIFIFIAVIAAAWLTTRRHSESQFKVREADRPDLDRTKSGKNQTGLANAKLKTKSPLALPGITLHGEPHEVLGIAENATEAEILKAYKNAIKQYHPDRIQGQAKDQIQFYQEASAQINQAKESMLQRIKNRS